MPPINPEYPSILYFLENNVKFYQKDFNLTFGLQAGSGPGIRAEVNLTRRDDDKPNALGLRADITTFSNRPTATEGLLDGLDFITDQEKWDCSVGKKLVQYEPHLDDRLEQLKNQMLQLRNMTSPVLVEFEYLPATGAWAVSGNNQEDFEINHSTKEGLSYLVSYTAVRILQFIDKLTVDGTFANSSDRRYEDARQERIDNEN